MAMKDDDDEEYVVNSAGVTRYPCMPSEVALQQMRNRMQLAKLGKKLMKWTAVSSSREMRTLGQQLEDAYVELNEKLQEAYIMLARSRYFNSNLNNIVTENVATNAAVLVESRLKARSGVKVMQQEMVETNHDPYVYLGLEKGGEIIMEAKRQWLEIIRLLILITQLRATFLMVEKANKAANKKKNVFSKIILPRTIETIAYIESCLEELAREDFFRLRRFIYKKRSTAQSYHERKPIEIKERLLPRQSKRLYKVECFMCGAFLRFSLVDEREKYLERKRIEELRFQMNEMLQIAKNLEEEGIVGVNVDEFIATAEKLKERLKESPHIDQLCRICKELLKRKHEKENKNQELKQIEQNDEKAESIALKSELFFPTIRIPKEKTDDRGTAMQKLNVEIDNDNEFSSHEGINKCENSNKINETFTEIYRDSDEHFTQLKEERGETTKKEISTITITKELKSELSMYNQSFLESPLETSVEKIRRVVTDEKENKSFVEEKFIITIKENIKNVIGKKANQTHINSSKDENNNRTAHETTTVIKIDSRLSSDPKSSERREKDFISRSELTIEDEKSNDKPTHSQSSKASNIKVKHIISSPSEGALEQKAPKLQDSGSNSHFLSLSTMQETIKSSKKEMNDKSTIKLLVRSTSFNDATISNTKIKDEFENETIGKSASSPSLRFPIDEPQEQRNDDAHNNYSRTSMEPEISENRNKVHTCCIQLKGNESNEMLISTATAKVQTPQKRVQICDIRRSNSLPTANGTCGITPRGSISYAGSSGAYIPPQNPTETPARACIICVSSSSLLSTELDTNKE